MGEKKTELKDLDPSADPKGGALMEPTVRNVTNGLGKTTKVVPNGLPKIGGLEAIEGNSFPGNRFER